MCMSMTTPSLHVCPWAAWAVAANPGANGNCFRVTRSTGRFRPLSRYHGFFCGATGKTLSSSIPSRLPFASLPTPYTLSSWGCKRASLQTPKRSPAALHSVLLKLLLKTPGCQPSNASTLRSGLTRSILGAFRRLPTSGRVLFAAALHILSLGVHECRLPAFRPLFKPLNPPQRLYTLSC